MRSNDIHILEDNVALSLDRVYPTLSRELLARKIKVEQDFVSAIDDISRFDEADEIYRAWYHPFDNS